MIRGDLVLTFHAVVVACRLVLLLPTRQADLLPLVAAGVVTEVVVARLAQDVAVRPVVLVRAHQAEVVLQLVLAVVPVHPLLPAVQALRLDDPVEQGGVGSCKKREVRMRLTNACGAGEGS